RKILQPIQHRLSYHTRSRLRRKGIEQEVGFPPDDQTAIARDLRSVYTPPVPESAARLAEPVRPTPDRAAPLPPPPPKGGPVKLNYTHEDCIDAILANPAITQTELATRYGYTQSWISL